MSIGKKFYLTKKGLEKLKKEYRDLKGLRLSKIKKGSPKIFQSEDLNFLESRIFELENIFKNSELIRLPSKDKQDIINLGATVTLEEPTGQINEFMIVGTLEANPSEGKISSKSPVGETLLGKKIGEEVVVTSPIKIIYKIKKIKYPIYDS